MTTHAKDGRAELLRRAIRLKQAAAGSRTPRLPPRPTDQDARLGELQRSLWLLQQLEPSSPAYNLTSAFRVPRQLHVEHLERGLRSLVARHRLLRSTFRAHGDSALQIVRDRSEAGADKVGLEQLAVGHGEALDTAVREARKPFDLSNGPLIRLLLIEETAGAERLLVLVLHHILADERSLSLLWQELAEGYNEPGLDTAQQPQYDDYVHWLASRERQSRATELAYWRRCLDPLPDDLMLPFERPAGTKSSDDDGDGRSGRGRLLSLAMGPEVARRIRRVAAATDTTPFVVFAFAFRLLLHRYSDGRDIAFATPVSRRSHPATAKMLGYFLNPVVIRGPIDEQRSVEQALRAFGRQMRDSLAHASVPFDVLVEALAPPRQRDRHPIFQTMFVYQETPPPPELGGTRLEPITLDLGESKFDLTLFVSEPAPETGSSLEVAVEYRADRFDEVWMHNLLGHYETLVGHLVEGLERPTAEIPMLRRQERDKLGADARGAPPGTSVKAESALLPRQILDQARRSQLAPALIGGDQEWSYGQLERVAGRVARELTLRGVKPGDRVGLFLDRCPLMIAGLVGCHWAGAAYVPLDPAYPSARNRDVLEDAEVSAVLTRSALLDRLPSGSWTTIDVEDFEGHGLEEGRPVPLPELCAEHPAYILYTSGSTGRPKGVVITHGNLRASNGARFQYYDTPPKRFLLLPSVAFDSSVVGIFWTLAAGGTLVIPTDDEARDPRRLARLVVEKAVTSLLCVPSLYAHILAAGGDRLRHLEIVIVAGESCPSPLVEEHFRQLPQARLFNEYGPTEATVWATVHEIEARDVEGSAGRGPIAIGRPIPGVRVDVLDSLGRRVPAGIPGQGWISGPTLAEGYWRRPELTEESFGGRELEVRRGEIGRQEPMYRTGDRMAWRADGRLLFLGRIDDQIKLRGFRIEPGEIEAALLDVPEIEQAAVVARATDQLVAFVETTGATETRATEVWRTELGQRLPEFMVPSRIVELPAMPRLPNGKVDRGKLREMVLEPVSSAGTGDVPLALDDRQQALVSLWQGLLGRTGIGPDDNFFQLGGHSLLVVEMTSAIEQDFGAVLAPTEVFQYPTIRQLAQRIEQQDGAGVPAYAHLFPIQPGGREAPFIFSVPHFFSEMVAARFRGERPVYGLRGVNLRPEGNRGRWRTMRDLGEELVDEIHHRFPDGSCIMAGYSFGATMAVEAVRLMEERGMPVRCLILIAPMPVDMYRLGPLRVQLDGLRQPAFELSLLQALRWFARDNHPLTLRPYRRIWRWLAIQPWRRLLCLVGKLRVLAGWPLTPRILHADVRLERFRLHARYRPGILRTPTIIFNAKEPATDAAATWRPYFKGPFTVHATPDPHLDAAHVQAAKDLILDHLDRHL